jgi:hypothetical protein
LNWFRKYRVQLNLELNLRFGSAGTLNLELNFGLVQPGSEPNRGNTNHKIIVIYLPPVKTWSGDEGELGNNSEG